MSNRDGAPDNAKGPGSSAERSTTEGTGSANDSLFDTSGPVALPEGEELQIWLSAFADGELPDPHAELLTAALEQDPALLAQLELIAATSATALSASESASLTDGILAAVAPTALDAEAADRLASLVADDALDDAGLAHLHASLAAQAQQVADFLDVTDATRAQAEAGAEHPSLDALLAPMPDLVADVVADDLRCAELSSLAVDGVITDREVDELTQLLTESPAHRDHREAGLAAFTAVSEATQLALEHVTGAPEAARAGAAALQAIGAAQAQADAEAARQQSRVPAVREHEAGLIGWLADRFRYLAPVAFAGAAAAVFFAVSDPRQLDPQGQPIDAPVDDILHTLEDDLEEELEQQKVALNEDLALLGDNHSDVLSIDTGSRATLVYETEASNITVIWVSDPVEDDEDLDGDDVDEAEAAVEDGEADEPWEAKDDGLEGEAPEGEQEETTTP
jgi:hypothetical protein